jgi:hypothetical protein
MSPIVHQPELRCPTCRESVVKPVRGGLGGSVLRLFSLHTFRCQICGERFRAEWHRADGARTPDRREFARVPVQVGVRLTASGTVAESSASDLSLKGCRIDPCAVALTVGSLCRVQLFLPGRAIDIARARVCSTEPRIGLEFLSMSRAAKIRLGLYVLAVWRNRGFPLPEVRADRPSSRVSA